MKGYLFGLGAMIVGAGLMFVLMHGEVSAESTEFTCETEIIKMQAKDGSLPMALTSICTGYGLKCVFSAGSAAFPSRGVSCVKTGMFK